MTGDALDILQDNIGYRFRAPELLRRSLTHSSTGAAQNYERLEFLGDRVVGLALAEILYETFPEESEGDMARRHAALVQGSMLARLARDIGLGDALQLSESERAAGGADNDNILADGFEGLMGALFLDGGYDVCRDLARGLWADWLHIATAPPRDPKTALQEWAQGRGLPLPVYEEIAREGPDHAPEFHIAVTVEGFGPESARGASRRKAEKQAAQALLERLEKTAPVG